MGMTTQESVALMTIVKQEREDNFNYFDSTYMYTVLSRY